MASPYQALEKPIAESRPDYQSKIEGRASHLVDLDSPIEELARRLSGLIGAAEWAHVIAEGTNRMRIAATSPGDGVNWFAANDDIASNLSAGTQRSFLLRQPLPGKRGNLLVCRLSPKRDDDEWREAFVFAKPVDKGRVGPTGIFISRAFGAIEGRIDFHVYWRRRRAGVALPLDSVEVLTHGLAVMLGPNVELTSTPSAVIVSRISQIGDVGDYNSQHMAEACIEELFGGRVLEQTFLLRARRFRAPEGKVDEFPVDIYGYPVHERSVLVTERDFGGESQVVIPKGWWWDTKPEPPGVTVEVARETALASEKNAHPEDSELRAEFKATVIWPDGPPGRVAHLVQIVSELSLCPTYVIDGTDGSILEKSHTVRF